MPRPQLLAAAVAVVDEVQQRSITALNQIRHDAGLPALFSGETKIYHPFDTTNPAAQRPDSETDTLVQLRVTDELTRATALYRDMWNAAAVRDASNMQAKADVTVDGQTLFADAPVPFLLYMEKQLGHLAALVDAMPVRDPGYRWEWDEGNGVHRTPEIKSSRKERVHRVLELSPPTDKFPAQTQPYQVEEPVGTYVLTKFSGAWDRTQKRETLERIAQVIDALKQARAMANRIEARTDFTPAERILQYILPVRWGVTSHLTATEPGQ